MDKATQDSTANFVENAGQWTASFLIVGLLISLFWMSPFLFALDDDEFTRWHDSAISLVYDIGSPLLIASHFAQLTLSAVLFLFGRNQSANRVLLFGSLGITLVISVLFASLLI